jgi:hypothetical protein
MGLFFMTCEYKLLLAPTVFFFVSFYKEHVQLVVAILVCHNCIVKNDFKLPLC